MKKVNCDTTILLTSGYVYTYDNTWQVLYDIDMGRLSLEKNTVTLLYPLSNIVCIRLDKKEDKDA